MPNFKIMIVEDEKILRISLRDSLINEGYKVTAFENPLEAFDELLSSNYKVLISDIKLPQISGIELLKKVKKSMPALNVILMTAHGSIDTAVQAMKEGAYDYISKPFKIEELIFKLKRLQEIELIKEQNINLREKYDTVYNSSVFVGSSQISAKLLNDIKTISNTNATVLITGETGTGKELIANIINNSSNRRDKPFIKVSCAILSREVFESELFGHVKGSYTGAIKDRAGRFEEADGGTIYLDDIDDVPIDLQVKLLRVLQEQEFERVGDNTTIKSDFRCIASTKADLLKMVKEGKFREDLYYRLNVFPMHIPPLRSRKEDLSDLIEYYSSFYSPNKKLIIQDHILEYLYNYSWPGNVRELKNIIERLSLYAQFSEIDISHLPIELLNNSFPNAEIDFGKLSLDEQISNYEISLIKKALRIAGNNKSKAADILKIPNTTLRSKIDKYKIGGYDENS